MKIDTTEVTVWYKIGTIAKQIYNFPLARMGFELVIIDKKKLKSLDLQIFLFTSLNNYYESIFDNFSKSFFMLHFRGHHGRDRML